MSSRLRKPSTGRTNDMDSLNESPLFISPRKYPILSSPSSSISTPPTPLSTKITIKPDQLLPPILPKNEDPTIPPLLSTRKPKHLSCPDHWIETNQSLTWLESANIETNNDTQGKQAYARDFVQRNQHQLWKFDPKYKNISPRQVCDDLLNNPGFIHLMRAYKMKEASLNLSSSRNMSESMKGLNYGKDSRGGEDLLERDCNNVPLSSSSSSSSSSLASTSTSTLSSLRNKRFSKSNHLFLQNTYSSIDTKNHRKGYNHTPDYGNFSKFCSTLKSNIGATLNR